MRNKVGLNLISLDQPLLPQQKMRNLSLHVLIMPLISTIARYCDWLVHKRADTLTQTGSQFIASNVQEWLAHPRRWFHSINYILVSTQKLQTYLKHWKVLVQSGGVLTMEGIFLISKRRIICRASACYEQHGLVVKRTTILYVKVQRSRRKYTANTHKLR